MSEKGVVAGKSVWVTFFLPGLMSEEKQDDELVTEVGRGHGRWEGEGNRWEEVGGGGGRGGRGGDGGRRR